MADELMTTVRPNVDVYKVLEKDVAAAATPETLTTERVYAANITVKSKPGNTGAAYISNSPSGPWFPVDGLSLSATPDRSLNLKEYYIKVSTDGDGVLVIYHSTGKVPS